MKLLKHETRFVIEFNEDELKAIVEGLGNINHHERLFIDLTNLVESEDDE